jgi:hypothetical protein
MMEEVDLSPLVMVGRTREPGVVEGEGEWEEMWRVRG